MIRFEQVSKFYPKGITPALDQVSLNIEREEFVFLVGASGSGKSTALRLIIREEPASAGRVIVAGNDLSRLSERRVPQLRRSIGMVFQDFRLLETRTAFENVAFACEVIGKPRRQIRTRVPEVLDMVGLTGKEKRYPHELSGGEQQRVAIARAFVNQPAILLADEPTGNLDPETAFGIMRVLELINNTGTTVVMATHDLQTVAGLHRRVIELRNSRIVRDQGTGKTAVLATAITPEVPIPHDQHAPHFATPSAVRSNALPHLAPSSSRSNPYPRGVR